MELTKTMSVMKALVETMLRREHKFEDNIGRKDEIKLGLDILRLMTADQRALNIVCNGGRHAQDFGSVIERPIKNISFPSSVRGLEGTVVNPQHFIVLHTGGQTEVQSNIRTSILETIELYCRHKVIWHIGEWRAVN